MSRFSISHLIWGLILLFLLFASFNAWLPQSFAGEEGPLEPMQVVILFIGSFVCAMKARSSTGRTHCLWIAGILFCFLLAGREISWGRIFFERTANGDFMPLQALPFGPIVHPLIGIMIVSIIALLIRGKVVHYFRTHDLPLFLHLLLMTSILIVLDAEKFHLLPHPFHSVIEETCETYAYAVFAYILYKMKAS